MPPRSIFSQPQTSQPPSFQRRVKAMSNVALGRDVTATNRIESWRTTGNYAPEKVSNFNQATAHNSGFEAISTGKSGKENSRPTNFAPRMLRGLLRAQFMEKQPEMSYSSGSEHDSLSLSNESIFEQEKAACNCGSTNCEGIACNKSGVLSEAARAISALSTPRNSLEREILEEVHSIIGTFKHNKDVVCDSEKVGCTGNCLRRLVMSELKSRGKNAAVCKSRWEHTKSGPGGDHEYIDVTFPEATGRERIIIDVSFRDQFTIARPSPQFQELVASVPAVFVGKPDKLQQIVDLMSEATKQSVKMHDLYLPPWRKPEYMQAKWFSSYKRTSNDVPSSSFKSACAVHAANQGVVPTMVNTDYFSRKPLSDISPSVDVFALKGEEEKSVWKLPTVDQRTEAKKVAGGLAAAFEKEKSNVEQVQVSDRRKKVDKWQGGSVLHAFA